MLRASALKGNAARVINIGSIAGVITPPFFGVYSGSKHAVEAITDSLRLEVGRMGISVSLLQPGSIDTSIEGKMIEQARNQTTKDIKGTYSARMGKIHDLLEYTGSSVFNKKMFLSSTDKTTAAILHALESEYPDTRYKVGPDAILLPLLSYLPDRMRDLVYNTAV